MSFDVYDQAFLADPYPTYKTLRASTPVFYNDTWDLTFVAGHSDVSDILKDRQRFGRDFRHRLEIDEVDHDLYHRIYPSRWPTWTRYIRESFIDLEPPRHTRLRRLGAKAFTRRSSEAFRSQLEDAANGILDRLLEEGTSEIIADFATPIPLAMIAELMGIPTEDHGQLVDWSHSIVAVFDQGVSNSGGDIAEKATADFVAYIEGVGRTEACSSRFGSDQCDAGCGGFW